MHNPHRFMRKTSEKYAKNIAAYKIFQVFLNFFAKHLAKFPQTMYNI